MKQNFLFLFASLCLFVTVTFGQAPKIFKISESIRPNGLISIYGEYLKGDVKVKFVETDSTVTPVQKDPNGQFIRVVMPTIAGGVYTLIVSNDGGKNWSDAVFLNKADLRWLTETSAYPGMKMKLMGRNLNPCAYNSSGETTLRMMSAKGDIIIPISKLDITNYALTFNIPQSLSVGSYFLEIRTASKGVGAQWIRYVEPINIVNAPTDTLALALGVSWSNDYNWTNIKNVKDYGARGDGSTDDTKSIQDCISDANSTGAGGIVYFPKGTYLYTGIKLAQKLILRGEDKNATILKYIGKGSINPDGSDAAIRFTGSGTIGIANLALTVDINKVTAPQTKLTYFDMHTKLFLYNIKTDVDLENNKDFGILANVPEGNLLIKNCDLSGTAIYASDVPQIQFVNNTVLLSHDEISMWGNKSLFENNKITGNFFDGKTTMHGFFIDVTVRGTKNLYYNNNVIENVQSKINQGEAFSSDGLGTCCVGNVVGADSNAVKFNKYFFSGRGGSNTLQVMIVSGKGMGQKRLIASYVDNGTVSLTTTTKWDVIPDNTSKCMVGDFVEDVVCEKFTINNCRSGIQYFANSYDNVLANNTLKNTQGIIFWSWQFSWGYVANYYCDVRKNDVSGASPQFGNTWMGIRDETGPTDNKYSINNYGNEYRDNTVTRDDKVDGGYIVRSHPAVFVLGYNNGNVTSGNGITATLLDNNTFSHSKEAIYQSPGVDATLERGTIFNAITSDKPYNDEGSNTIRISGTPAPPDCASVSPPPPPQPLPPQAGADNAIAQNNGNATTLAILNNDKASDGNPATLNNVTLPTITSPPAHGTGAIKGDGTLSYTPTPGYSGTDVLMYQICDKVNSSFCGSATVTLTIPTSLVANPDYAISMAGITTHINVLSNDSKNNVLANLGNVSVPLITQSPNKGTVISKADGTLDYTPSIAGMGNDVLIYQICDKITGLVCDTALVTIVFKTMPPPPPEPTVPVNTFECYRVLNNAYLTWKLNNSNAYKYFEIERSFDSIKFDKIGTVPSVSDTALHTFNMTDYSIQYLGAKIIYYRIAYIDSVFSKTYSKILSINVLSTKPRIDYYPNPTANDLNLIFDEFRNYNATIKVIDLTGREVLSVPFVTNLERQITTVDVTGLTPGLYILQFIEPDQTQTIKFLKG